MSLVENDSLDAKVFLFSTLSMPCIKELTMAFAQRQMRSIQSRSHYSMFKIPNRPVHGRPEAGFPTIPSHRRRIMVAIDCPSKTKDNGPSRIAADYE
jgi:hypothetical protein